MVPCSNSGQCCCGIERIYVHESLFDAFVEKAVAIVNGYKLGNPLDPETDDWPDGTCAFCFGSTPTDCRGGC